MSCCLSVPLQVEATGPEHRADGDIQRGLRCIISAGAMRGLQKKRGAPLLTLSRIRQPGPGAADSETHRNALCHQILFSRCKEALHPLLHPRVRHREVCVSFSQLNQSRVARERDDSLSLNMKVKCFCLFKKKENILGVCWSTM